MKGADTNYRKNADRSALANLNLITLTPPLGRGIPWVIDPDSYLFANDEIKTWR